MGWKAEQSLLKTDKQTKILRVLASQCEERVQMLVTVQILKHSTDMAAPPQFHHYTSKDKGLPEQLGRLAKLVHSGSSKRLSLST